MKRRTFTKQSSSLGLAMLLAPFTTLQANTSPWKNRIDLSPAVKAHLDHFSDQLKLGGLSDQRLINQYIDPVRIEKSDIRLDSYLVEYQNQQQQRIVLSSKKGVQKIQILA